MKKYIAVLSLAALALTVTPAFAHEGKDKDKDSEHVGFGAKVQALFHHENKGLHLGQIKNDSSRFILVGTVASVGTNSLVVNFEKGANVGTSTAGSQVTVVTNSSTKLGDGDKDDDNKLTLSSLKAGDRVVVSGSVAGSVLTATNVRLLKAKASAKAFGTVTAVTPTSVTITNAKTGVAQTVTTTADTKVMVDGEASTTADIQVGDRGFVKFKNDVSGMIAKFIALFR